VPTPSITIPEHLRPVDGRFGCGPSKIRPAALESLANSGTTYLGTSHRQNTVKSMVGRLRGGLRELFALPDDYEVLLGNGGSTAFWDIATFALIEHRSQHLVFGEFSSKFAEAAAAAPHLGDPVIIESTTGSRPSATGQAGIDSYCLTHNETSTGVAMPIARPVGADADAIVLVDATSAAGGIVVAAADYDCYYFAPQKCFASDGGLWTALVSPSALARVASIRSSKRWIPASMDLSIAIENSTKDQTYNTPALATIFLFVEQVEWMLANGGLPWAAARSKESSDHLYAWASASAFATPFVVSPADRSPVVVTIDLEGADANAVSAALRANGIVDTDSYRKLGRNQLRVATFPSIDPDDVRALTNCIDFVVSALS
jgi:phosphoserine aminotransferase